MLTTKAVCGRCTPLRAVQKGSARSVSYHSRNIVTSATSGIENYEDFEGYPSVQDDGALETGPEDNRLPVTVITGFLGSGKTTLLNYILSQDHGKRIAVIENEFGEIGIDNELIKHKEALGEDGDVTILENGCVCCTVLGDLVEAVGSLVERGGFDHIVIETTGLANPAPIITTFFMEESIYSKVRLDGICTVVDAKHISAHFDRKEDEEKDNEACAQVAYADRIILNKRDLVTSLEMQALTDRIRKINRLATIETSQNAVVPLNYVLGIGGYALEEITAQVGQQVDSVKEEAAAHSHSLSNGHDHSHSHSHSHSHHDHDHSHHHHDHSYDEEEDSDSDDCMHDHDHHHHGHAHHPNIHDDAVNSASFVIEGAMDLQKLNLWIGGLLEHISEDIYRMKGILNIHHNKERFVFQGVHNMFTGTPDREWEDGEERISRMVFIGRNLPMDQLRDGFEDCLYVEGEAEKEEQEYLEELANSA